jgi:hypothetical protein
MCEMFRQIPVTVYDGNRDAGYHAAVQLANHAPELLQVLELSRDQLRRHYVNFTDQDYATLRKIRDVIDNATAR